MGGANSVQNERASETAATANAIAKRLREVRSTVSWPGARSSMDLLAAFSISTPIQLSGYRLGLPTAGSLILLVNEFSSDHTQGSSPISTPGRSFIILSGPMIGFVYALASSTRMLYRMVLRSTR